MQKKKIIFNVRRCICSTCLINAKLKLLALSAFSFAFSFFKALKLTNSDTLSMIFMFHLFSNWKWISIKSTFVFRSTLKGFLLFYCWCASLRCSSFLSRWNIKFSPAYSRSSLNIPRYRLLLYFARRRANNLSFFFVFFSHFSFAKKKTSRDP